LIKWQRREVGRFTLNQRSLHNKKVPGIGDSEPSWACGSVRMFHQAVLDRDGRRKEIVRSLEEKERERRRQRETCGEGDERSREARQWGVISPFEREKGSKRSKRTGRRRGER